MNFEVLGTVMGSFGGAAVIVAGLAKFLGKVWTDRLAKETSAKINNDLESLKAKFKQDLELVKSKSTKELESLKAENTEALEHTKHELALIKGEQEQFGGISLEFYQKFFNERVSVYLNLLEIKNKYITEMEEEFITEIHEGWGHVYHSTYLTLRALMIKKQLYISNELEEILSKLRKEASHFIKEADFEESHSYGGEHAYENDRLLAIYEKFASSTNSLMKDVMAQIGTDVSRLRARVELDKA